MGMLPSTLPARKTNPGILLTSEYFGGESDTIREVPPEFRAALDLVVLEIPLPWDQRPPFLSDTILASKAEQKVTSERIQRVTTKPPGPVTLTEILTNKDKQLVTRTRNFKFYTDAVASPSPTVDVKTQNLGNKHIIEDIEDAQFVFPAKMSSIEILDVTPEIFKALVPMRELRQTYTGVVPDTQPPLGPGQYRHEQVQDNVFNLTDTLKTRIPLSGYPITINPAQLKMTPEQQIETISMTLDLGVQTLVVTPTTLEAEMKILGDGTSIATIGTVPSVFPKLEGETAIPDLIPQEFRGILPLQTEATTFTGTALPEPVLGAGELSRKEEQLTVYNMRRTVTFRDVTALPATLTSYKLTPEKIVETVTSTLNTGLQNLVGQINEFTVEAEVKNLGNNLSIKTIGTVPIVFSAKVASTEVPDLVPEIFRALLPTHVEEIDIAGTVVDPPVLSPGDFEKRETQKTQYVKRIYTKGRAGISYPQSIVVKRQIGGERFGGEITQLAGYLDVVEPPVETGLNIVTSEVSNLGNGTWFRQTEKLNTAIVWPILTGSSFDKEFQVYNVETTQTVDPSYTIPTPTVGINYVESVKPIDQYHSRRERKATTPAATSEATALLSEAWRPYQFPGWLAFAGAGYYVRKTRAELCQHITKTWWESSATKPTTGPTGSGADVIIDPIIQDNIIISTLNDTTRLAYSGECLHDTLTTFGSLTWPATTPDKTTYVGSWIGTSRKIAAEITQTDVPFRWKIQTTEVVMR